MVPIIGPRLISNTTSGTPISKSPTKPYDQMTESEKVNTIIQTYFEASSESKDVESNKKENDYIKNLPRDSNCADNYVDCKKWADSGECVINPEFMVYNCKSSCESCSLTPQQLYNVTAIYNDRDPPGCAFHGFSYPDPITFRRDVLNYS